MRNREVPEMQRFWQKVSPIDLATGCMLWIGTKDRHGYGCFKSTAKPTSAHRFSYELHYGPIPRFYEINHKCRVPSCVSPAHLEALTVAEHRRVDSDLIRAGSQKKCGVKTAKNSSGYANVFMAKGRWRAQYAIDGRIYYVGSYQTAEDADLAVRSHRATVLAVKASS